MINIDKLLGQNLNSGQGKTLAGGLLVGGLAGALTGKTGQKMAASALKLGGAAAVAGLAYTAYQRYRTSQPQASLPNTRTAPPASMTYDARTPARPQPVGEIVDIVDIAPLRNSGYLPPAADSTATEALSLKLIRAMICAAKADGRIDASESAKIFGQIETLGLDPEEKSFLLTEIGKPLSARDVAAAARTPEEAAEI